MRPRALLGLAAALAASVGLYLFAQRLTFVVPPGFLDPEVGRPLLAGLDPAKVRRIEVRNGPDAVGLARKAGRWAVASHRDRRADPEPIGFLCEGLAEARIVEVRSPTNENLDAYLLREEEALRVEIESEGEAAPRWFLVGKFAENPIVHRFEFFVRLPGNPKILVAEGIRAYRFGWERLTESEGGPRRLKPDRFYDLRVCQIERKDLDGIEVRAGGERLRVAPEGEEGWRVAAFEGPAGFALDAKRVDQELFRIELADLFVSGYWDGPGPAPGLGKPASEIALRRKDGKEWRFRVGSERIQLPDGPGDDYARYALGVEGDPEVYLLNHPQWQRLSRGPREWGVRPERNP